jgi:hypothetical protein
MSKPRILIADDHQIEPAGNRAASGILIGGKPDNPGLEFVRQESK